MTSRIIITLWQATMMYEIRRNWIIQGFILSNEKVVIINITKRAGIAVVLITCIWEVHGWNPG
jgi:hypothetical protein